MEKDICHLMEMNRRTYYHYQKKLKDAGDQTIKKSPGRSKIGSERLHRIIKRNSRQIVGRSAKDICAIANLSVSSKTAQRILKAVGRYKKMKKKTKITSENAARRLKFAKDNQGTDFSRWIFSEE